MTRRTILSPDRRHLYDRPRRKRTANQLYVDALVLVHALLSLLPGPVRNRAWALLLGSCGSGCYFDHRVYVKFPWLVHLGDDVSLNRGVEFYPGGRDGDTITLGNDVYVGPHARFHAAGHDTTDLASHTGAPVTVGDGAWIGTGAVVLQGVHVGAGSIVAAGAVVTQDVPDGTVVGGVPARVLRDRDARSGATTPDGSGPS